MKENPQKKSGRAREIVMKTLKKFLPPNVALVNRAEALNV